MTKLGRGVAISVVVMGAAIVAAACGKTAGGTDSNTHWMDECGQDSDCGNLSCLCGVCTRECSGSGSCRGLGSDAVCAMPRGCGAGDRPVCIQVGEEGGASAGGAANTGGRAAASGGSIATGDAIATGGAGGGSEDIPDGPLTAPCASADVRQVGDPRCGPAGPMYHWNGHQCLAISCCGGADCGRTIGYPTMDACDRAHTECYAVDGVSRACTQNTDCRLTDRACCGCGQRAATTVIAVRSDSVTAYRNSVCRPATGECPPCVPVENESLSAICVNGECKVLDVEPYTVCDQDENCTVAQKSCCDTCTADVAEYVAISIDDNTSLLPFRGVVCPSNPIGFCDGGGCAPEGLRARCSMGRCELVAP